MSLGSVAPLPSDLHRYVGKTDLGEVLVDGLVAKADDTHVVTARWPGVHRFYTPDPDMYSPHILTESIRQSLALLSRTAFDIPASSRMGWEAFELSVVPGSLRTEAQDARVRLAITHSGVTRRKLGSVRLSASVEATRGELRLGSAQVTYSAHPPAIYDRLRGPYADPHAAMSRLLPPPPPVAAAPTGCRRPQDVVLAAAETPRTWLLRTDTGHPVLFDHPHDHVPGMVLLEACGQAARATVHPSPALPTGFSVRFLRYVEFDQPCRIVATSREASACGRHTVEVVGVQNDRTVFTSSVMTQPFPTRLRPEPAPAQLH
ncbi:ScbA/BarX family gamma-butyrolactone biosynthesis protein [Streptomyces beigongshangae]|uniref:ScbA/BarX family gamma-butyrolactone biosynthesis protein n=1 Tax=Streptomyces beigongshangae TaxID=2841597 RepID=UPI001C854BEF|nr:ScbA/BarX family gamma-butyrolactone biosynthesis protein [Streptomyces sp. REN17]